MDKAMEYIDKLAAKLGVAAEHVYGVLVKQQMVSGVIGIFGMIAAIIFLGIVFTKLLKKE